MAPGRWALDELVSRLCAKIGAPKPSSLSSSALAASALHADLIDSIEDAVHRLLLRLNPEELYDTVIKRTVAASDVTIACLNGSTTITWTDTDTDSADADSWAFPVMSLKSYDGIYELSSISGTGTKTATLDREFNLDSGSYEGYITTREIALPTDFKTVRKQPYNITGSQRVDVITLNQLEEMARTHKNVDMLRLSPGSCRYLLQSREFGGTPYLMTYPSTLLNDEIRIPYVRAIDVYDASEDTASEFYYPISPHHQHLILDACIVEIMGHQMANGQPNQAYYDSMKRLSQALTDVSAEMDIGRNDTMIEPVTYASGRRLWSNGRFARRLPRDFDREDW